MAAGIALCGSVPTALGGPRVEAKPPKEPVVTGGPVISGTPRVGETLSASATWAGNPPPDATWSWLRCARPEDEHDGDDRAEEACSPIGANPSATYGVTASDVGSVLRVRLTVTNKHGSDEQRSPATAVVIGEPGPPTPTPTPTPEPTFDNSSTRPVLSSPVPAGAPGPSPSGSRMLKPFPVVRIKGVLTARGARVTLLKVTAPRGARTTLVCRGRDCPLRRFVPAAGVKRLRRFERELRAGTRLRFTITKPGYIGKRTLIVIRRHARPWRKDRCLKPGGSRVVPCGVA